MRRRRFPFDLPVALWLAIAVVLAALLRTYNLSWDQDAHLHPDERYLTMVVSAVRFPGELASDPTSDPARGVGCSGVLDCIGLYLDTSASPLNPANYEQFAGYVYGTLPLFTTRALGLGLDRACSNGFAPIASLLSLTGDALAASCQPGFYSGYGGIHLVGRALSTLADLVTLVGLGLIAQTLYGRRTAIVASVLYAFAVLPIQHAHFFVVDSFATVFVIWTLYFCLLSLRRHNVWLLLPAGITTGLAVASKVSVFPLAGVVALAGLLRPGTVATSHDEEMAPDDTPRARQASGAYLRWGALILALGLSGVLAALMFRLAQPYAFTGPGLFDVAINPQWMDTMRGIRDLMRGLQDVPYGHQWTARTPLVFPWRNMVFWGLGLPLGLAAWVGWALMGWRLVKVRWQRSVVLYLLPWVWGTGFFLYQGTQWVKSMRYLLPIYPVFVLFAAWFVIRAIRWGRMNVRPLGRLGRTTRIVRRFAAGAALAVGPVVLLGTALWALAFLSIYRQPVTRLEASRWMYEHIPTAVTLQTDDGQTLNVAFQPSVTLEPASDPVRGQVEITEPVIITAVALPKVSGIGSGERIVSVEINGAKTTAAIAVPEAEPAPVVIPLAAPVTLQPDDRPVVALAMEAGAPISLSSSVIANEHWDDPLPLRMDGKDPFWNWYRGLSSSPSTQMNNYDNDTPEKRAELLAWLDEADVIALSSNRLYASIPRLPRRYPLTTEYYRRLFSGELGFELAAEFVSYPALGPCQFPDQEIPFPLVAPQFTNARPCSLALPAAEEAFSVYDHPTVLIFTKTPAYSRARAEALLPEALVENVQWMTPREATLGQPDAPPLPVMPAGYRLQQESGGTWSRLFRREALHNRYPFLGVVVWGLMLTVLGWLTFPMLYLLLPQLRYRGYGLSRIAGLLIWSYAAWILASLRLLPYTRAVLWLLFLVLGLVAVWIVRRHRQAFGDFLRLNWRHLLTIDLIFTVLFLIWVGVRWANPDLWHPVTGGEKPMDFAYLNAVIKSTWFPPYDPWFAGGSMNYYYFGFVIFGSLIKALGIVPSIAYNLTIPTLYGLVGVGAYTLANNLAGGDARRGRRAGLWGVLFVLVLGNLGEVRLLYGGLARLGNVDFESLIPGYPQVVSFLVGLWKIVIEGETLPFRPEWWYWDARSLIPAPPGEVAPINEFPAFTLIYADLHAHIIALPITQLALGIALQWAVAAAKRPIRLRRGQRRWRQAWEGLLGTLPRPLGSIVLAGLVAGTLKATNTWDYPTYLALMSMGLVVGLAARVLPRLLTRNDEVLTRDLSVDKVQPEILDSHGLSAAVAGSAGVGGIGDPPAAQENSGVGRSSEAIAITVEAADRSMRTVDRIEQASASGTDAAGDRSWVVLLLIWITPLLIWAWGELLFRPYVLNYASAYSTIERWEGSHTPLGTYFLMHGHFILPILAGAFVGLLRMGRRWRQREDVTGMLWMIVLMLMTILGTTLLVGFLEVDIAWLAVPLGLVAAMLLFAGGTPLRRRLLWFWVGTALAISLFVELFVLRGDIGRMNTVFKFYYQVWLLLAVTTAVMVERILHAPCGLATLLHPYAAPTTSEVAAEHPCPPATPRWLLGFSDAVAALVAILVFGAGLYPAFGIPAKMRDRWVPSAPATLDGALFMRHAMQIERGTELQLEADYRVIHWLQENVTGSPTIIEGVGEREYLWGSRVSVYTGLPTVIGWNWHQRQQRMTMAPGTVERRIQDVRHFYSSMVPEHALEILETYEVDYVVLGPYERAYMIPEGLPKFATMVERGWLEIVYEDEASTIYRVVS